MTTQTDVTICFIDGESGPEMVMSSRARAEGIAVRWSDLARILQPFGADPAPRRDRVGAFRLSYRE
jgi:hypothetical protein